jgi:ABC-2 type transport system permease protein
MKKSLLVLQYELVTTLRRPSFLLMAFGVPLLAILIVGGVTLVRGEPAGGGQAATPGVQTFHLEIEGYVDHSGLIDTIPRGIPRSNLLAYDGEAQAQQALASGKIAAYYVIPEDYVERGEIYYVYPDTRPLTSDGQKWVMLKTLLVNLVGGDGELAELVWNPMNLQATNLAPEPPPDATPPSPTVRYLPALMVVLLFTSFMINANLMSESVSTEKENRTIETLMLSVTPRQMLTGKIAGLGIAALLHTAAWLGTVFALLSLGGGLLRLPAGFTLPASILAWGLVFYLLGLAVYGSLMAGVGALASKLKEASQASFLILSPLMAGYVVGILAPLVDGSRGALPVALSLFPLTAPVVMIMRLTDGSVPLWQLLLSAGLMLATAYGIVRGVAAMFRAQYLLSGQSFSVKRYFGALLGRG